MFANHFCISQLSVIAGACHHPHQTSSYTSVAPAPKQSKLVLVLRSHCEHKNIVHSRSPLYGHEVEPWHRDSKSFLGVKIEISLQNFSQLSLSRSDSQPSSFCVSVRYVCLLSIRPTGKEDIISTTKLHRMGTLSLASCAAAPAGPTTPQYASATCTCEP